MTANSRPTVGLPKKTTCRRCVAAQVVSYSPRGTDLPILLEDLEGIRKVVLASSTIWETIQHRGLQRHTMYGQNNQNSVKGTR